MTFCARNVLRVALLLASLPPLAQAEQGLLAHYKFDEGAGTTAADSSGGGVTATLINGPTWGAGALNGCLTTNLNYADFGSSPALNFAAGAPLTVSGWFKTTDSKGMLFSMRHSVDPTSVVDVGVGYLTTNDPGKLMGMIRDTTSSGQGWAGLAGGVVNDGAWHHFAMTRNAGNTVELYLDGVSQGTNSNSASGGSINTNLRGIGAELLWKINGNPQDEVYLNGSIDDIRVYSRKLANAEILAMAQKKLYANADAYSTTAGTALNVPSSGVLGNDGNFTAGGGISAILDTNVTHGSLNLNADGSFSYTPTNGYAGSDSFTYHASDGQGADSAPAQVLITVTNAQPGLVMHYRFDEGAGAVAGDSSGSGKDGTLVNSPAWTTGKIAGGLDFDGSNDYVNINNFSWPTGGPVTVAFWNNVATNQLQAAAVFGSPEPGGRRFQSHAPNGNGILYWDYGDYNGAGGITCDYHPYLDKWTHVVLVSEGVGGKFKAIYLDGALINSSTSSDGPNSPLTSFQIGHSAAFAQGSYQHKGKVDDFRIYNRVLSAGEVSALMQGKPYAAPDTYGTPVNATLAVSAPGVLGNDSPLTGYPLTAVLDTTVSHGSLTLNSDGSFSYTPTNGYSGPDSFNYHVNDGHGIDSATAKVSINVVDPQSGLRAWYKFEEGSGAAAADSSGNNNNATLINSPTWTNGAAGRGLSFDGADDYASVPQSATLEPNDITVCLWANITNARASVVSELVRKAGPNQTGYLLRWSGGDGKLQFRLDRKLNPGVFVLDNVPNSTYLNAWHHFAGTYTASTGTARLFVDGVLHASVTGTPGNLEPTDPLYMMWYPQGTHIQTPGTIDDVRIYGRALDASELQIVMQLPPTANADTYGTPPNQALSTAAPGVLANDFDINGDSLTAVKDSDPANGILTLNADGSFSYTPNNGFLGNDTFTYHVSDGHGNSSATATVTINVSDIPAGLVVWYKFDEGAGTSASDSSGNNNAGTLTNGPVWSAGPLGGALTGDGTNDYVTAPSFNWPSGGPVTVTFWNRVGTSEVQPSCPFGVGSGGNNKLQAHVPHSDRSLYWDYGNISANGRITTNYISYLDKWTHVALVSQGAGGNFKAIYLNGQLAASEASSSGPSTPISSLHVLHSAADAVEVGQHKGSIDDFRIYNRVLSASEIAQLAEASPTTTAVTGTFAAPFKTTAQNVPLSATVNATGPVTEGTVTFQLKNGATNVGTAITANVTNGTASGTYVLPASTPLGAYTIQATFNGTVAFATSVDTSKTLTVQLASTTLAAANSVVGFSASDQLASLTAAVTSAAGTVNEGTVTFQIKNGAANIGNSIGASVSNGTASVSYTIPAGTPLGTYSIEAAYTGTNFAASSDNTHTLKVVAPSSLAAENATVSYKATSQTVTLNATVTGAGGPVNEGTVTFQIKNGAANVGTAATSPTVANGSASAVYTIPAGTPAGTYSIFASYSGGPNVPPSSDNAKTLTIIRTSSTTAPLNATAAYSFADQIAPLSAQVTSPGGVVNEGSVSFQIKSGANNIGSAATSDPITNGSAAANYIIPAGTLPGTYTIQANYSGGTNFNPSSDSTRTLTVLKATPVIVWPNPADIQYGTALGAAQLNASVGGIPGTFTYNPPNGTLLAVGNAQPLSVTFTPADTTNYNSSQKSASINVTKKVLIVTADNKNKLFGVPNPTLTASYSGFANNETAAVLTGAPTLTTSVTTSTPPGSYPITITQGSLSAANYSFTFINGVLTVSNQPGFSNLSAPAIDFGTPSTILGGNITFGTTGSVIVTFNGVTKSATIDGAGGFAALFPTGTLEIGTYPIQYFFPGGGSLAPVSDSRTLTVIKGTPPITWANPADIEYGTPLSSAQLNATTPAPGTFTYVPPLDTLLPVGTHQLTASFAPADLIHYVSTSASVTLIVTRATPNIVWETPADLSYGTALSELQLNATCDLSGTFTYDPAAGTVLDPGPRQLSVNFVPDDLTNYSATTVSVTINILKSEQAITFDAIPDQEIGNPPLTLSATSSSNLPVTLTKVSGPAELIGNTLTLQGLGAVTIRAEQTGDEFYDAASPVDRTFNIVVLAPHITSALTAAGAQNAAFAYTLTASGTKPIALSTGTLPAGLSFNFATGEISGTPTGSGAFQIAVTATNSAGSETKTLTLIFANSGGGENHAPRFISPPVITPNPAAVNKEIDFSAAGADEDGDSIAYEWDFGDGAQGFGAQTTHRYTAAGIYSVTLTIRDASAFDYLNSIVVINGTIIPPDQYAQFTVAKLALKFNFIKANADSLSISGTIPIPAGFAPLGAVVDFESGNLARSFTLDKKGASASFKLTGKLAKDGTFTASPAKYALALKNQALFADLSVLGFVNDNTPKGMIVPMPIVITISGTHYLANVNVAYAAKKGKSGSGKK